MDSRDDTASPPDLARAGSETVDGIAIRAAEPTDGASLAALLSVAGAVEGLMEMPHAQIAARAPELVRFEPRNCNLVAVDSDARVVGTGSLSMVGPSPRTAHRRTLGIAIAPEWQGRGLGDKMMMHLLWWADRWAGVLRIELIVYADNARAIALYQRHGFVREGVHRAYGLRDGAYVDADAMARLHPRPPSVSR